MRARITLWIFALLMTAVAGAAQDPAAEPFLTPGSLSSGALPCTEGPVDGSDLLAPDTTPLVGEPCGVCSINCVGLVIGQLCAVNDGWGNCTVNGLRCSADERRFCRCSPWPPG